jgi:hypothetical protein
VIVDPVEEPIYLQIADKAKHLRDLGMNDKAIARVLGVSDKTAAKSLARRDPGGLVKAEDPDSHS